MSEMVQIRKKAQITLPASVRQKLGIEEGDFVDVQIKDGDIVLKVMKLVSKEQAWFWTKRWQNGEGEAEEDIRSGKVHRFKDSDDAIAFLHRQSDKEEKDTGA
ncbi:MAG TPA: AbrB family transcriptional regulator [Dehalococcoidia bacterium]|nr:AbrB family transcriptional regulator [Dehalococcoidia bacterium]HAS28226.1 AbrB family transcriptional regulator [Dehalococcoidia bacterium]